VFCAWAASAWAEALDNGPRPSTAIKTPARQKTEANKTRTLKKADCEVDFFFMVELHVEYLIVERNRLRNQRFNFVCWRSENGRVAPLPH
jgi:hypothetical protein